MLLVISIPISCFLFKLDLQTYYYQMPAHRFSCVRVWNRWEESQIISIYCFFTNKDYLLEWLHEDFRFLNIFFLKRRTSPGLNICILRKCLDAVYQLMMILLVTKHMHPQKMSRRCLSLKNLNSLVINACNCCVIVGDHFCTSNGFQWTCEQVRLQHRSLHRARSWDDLPFRTHHMAHL